MQNTVILGDCIEGMKGIPTGTFELTLTDIPYDAANRSSGGLRNLDKGAADVITFPLLPFCEEVERVSRGSIIIFCGKEQLSDIYRFFAAKQERGLGTVRQLVWQKSNPSPMNGQYVYLSGIENAVWFKHRGAAFNARCKNTVFKYPSGHSKLHPTEKNHALLRELILDNSNEGDTVFDPCCGSGSHLLVAKECGRNYYGIELNEKYYNIAKRRVEVAS